MWILGNHALGPKLRSLSPPPSPKLWGFVSASRDKSSELLLGDNCIPHQIRQKQNVSDVHKSLIEVASDDVRKPKTWTVLCVVCAMCSQKCRSRKNIVMYQSICHRCLNGRSVSFESPGTVPWENFWLIHRDNINVDRITSRSSMYVCIVREQDSFPARGVTNAVDSRTHTVVVQLKRDS